MSESLYRPPSSLVLGPSDVTGSVESAWSTERMTTHVLASFAVLVLVTSRLALPLGAKQVPLALLLGAVHIGLVVILTRGAIAYARLAATAVTLGLIFIATALVHRHASMMSLLYLVLIYAPLVVKTDLDGAAVQRIWRVFIGLAAFAAVLGVLQIVIQAVAGGYYLDPIQLLPDNVQLQGYQTTYPIMRGVIPTQKANGMLFPEPSVYSQFLGLALLGEVWLYRRWKVLTLLVTGITLAFSGTGLMMLAAGILWGARPRAILALGAVGAIAAVALFATGYGEAFTSRVDEVRRPGTSGYERFVAPFKAMQMPWRESVDVALWGYGAGRVEELDSEVQANYSPVPKVFLEYGLIGLLGFTVIWCSMFLRLQLERSIIGAMLVMYFLAGGSLLQPFTVYPLWALSAGFAKRPRVAEPGWSSAAGPGRAAWPGAVVR